MSSSMNSSSINVGENNLAYDNSSPYPRPCNCKLMMKLQISRRPRSYGNRFFSCPNSWDGVGGCGVFIWFDPPEGSNVVVPYQSVKDEFIELKKEMGKVTDVIVKFNHNVEDSGAGASDLPFSARVGLVVGALTAGGLVVGALAAGGLAVGALAAVVRAAGALAVVVRAAGVLAAGGLAAGGVDAGGVAAGALAAVVRAAGALAARALLVEALLADALRAGALVVGALRAGVLRVGTLRADTDDVPVSPVLGGIIFIEGHVIAIHSDRLEGRTPFSHPMLVLLPSAITCSLGIPGYKIDK
ncbi:hypothetical protein ACFE04_027274 [Oxalis oulophora]